MALHCSQYVEVGQNGKVYKNWRLPTKEEVSVILEYQYEASTKETIAEVLAARYYYTLDGGTAENTYEERTGSNGTFGRCIRDLDDDDIQSLSNNN